MKKIIGYRTSIKHLPKFTRSDVGPGRNVHSVPTGRAPPNIAPGTSLHSDLLRSRQKASHFPVQEMLRDDTRSTPSSAM